MNTLATPRMVKVKSSNVEEVGHDGARHELHVKFKGGGHYVYADVHNDIFMAMLNAKSPGRFHAESVKDVFKHRKL